MSDVSAQIKCTGVVQGVGYRYFCYQKALGLGLTGWVSNRTDGSVEVVAEGGRSAIEIYLKELKVGPDSATVSEVKVKWLKFAGKNNKFEIITR